MPIADLATADAQARRQWLVDVTTAPPGPELLAELAAVPVEALDQHGRAFLLEAWERQCRWVAARGQQILAGIAGPDWQPGSADDWASADVAVALDVAPSTAGSRIAVARRLAGPLAATAAALARGELSAQHATALAEETAELSDEMASEVQERVMSRRCWRTVPQLRRAVRKALAQADPVAVEVAHAEAAEKRTVARFDDRDGMAGLTAWLPAPDVELVFTALDACAGRSGPEDPRGLDARRADVLVDWALLALDRPDLPTAHRRKPHIQVTVDLPTLLGLADNPGELAGYGPIPASAARALAAVGEWHRLVTDPVSGALLDYGRRTYVPPAALADFVIARDGTCRFPGCSVPARRCDLDHIVPFDQGGSTSSDNLAALCRRHHRLKTHGGWRYALTADASVTWTSPRGISYLVPPRRLGP